MPDGDPNWGQEVPQWQDSNRSTIALVFGILGLLGCGILAPVAWWLGRKELYAIEAGIRSPSHRTNAKTGKVLGIVGTIMTVLLIPLIALVAINAAREQGVRDADGAIVRSATFHVEDLRVGDCGDWPEGEVVLSIDVHPCSEPHDFELYAVVIHPDGPGDPYQGQRSLEAWSEQACYEQFEPYVGVAFEDAPTLTFEFLYPLEASWEDGDRDVQCALRHIAGQQLIGSKKGSDLDEADLDASARLRGWQ